MNSMSKTALRLLAGAFVVAAGAASAPKPATAGQCCDAADQASYEECNSPDHFGMGRCDFNCWGESEEEPDYCIAYWTCCC